MVEPDGLGPGRVAIKVAGTFVGVVTLTAGLTVLFLCARAVMDIGGSCGSGGPYEIAHPCPKGIGWLTPVSILLGLVSVGWLAFWNAGLPGPKAVMFAWPALFLSLGWNFWVYGLDPPGGRGTDVGWIICGVVFVVMGGLPLLALRSSSVRRSALWADAGWSGERSNSVLSPRRWAARPSPRPAGTATPPDAGGSSGIADELERLARLHRSGTLTDEEFAAAKRRVVGG